MVHSGGSCLPPPSLCAKAKPCPGVTAAGHAGGFGQLCRELRKGSPITPCPGEGYSCLGMPGRSAGRAQRAKCSCWQPEVGHIRAQQGQFRMPFAGKTHPLIRHLLAALSLGHWVTELGPGSLDKMTFSIGDFWLFFSLFPPHNKLNPFTCHFEVCITGYLSVRISSSPQLGMKPSTHIRPFVAGRLWAPTPQPGCLLLWLRPAAACALLISHRFEMLNTNSGRCADGQRMLCLCAES